MSKPSSRIHRSAMLIAADVESWFVNSDTRNKPKKAVENIAFNNCLWYAGIPRASKASINLSNIKIVIGNLESVVRDNFDTPASSF